MREIVQSGEIGDVTEVDVGMRIFSGSFSRDDIRFNYPLAGGAMVRWLGRWEGAGLVAQRKKGGALSRRARRGGLVRSSRARRGGSFDREGRGTQTRCPKPVPRGPPTSMQEGVRFRP